MVWGGLELFRRSYSQFTKNDMFGVNRVPKGEKSGIFENRPERNGRIFGVRGSFPSGSGSKLLYSFIPFQKKRNHEKILIFKKVMTEYVTQAKRHQKNKKMRFYCSSRIIYEILTFFLIWSIFSPSR